MPAFSPILRFVLVEADLSCLPLFVTVLDGGDGEEKYFSATQNVVDFLMALNDVRERETDLGDPRFLSALGIVSAAIGIRDKWLV